MSWGSSTSVADRRLDRAVVALVLAACLAQLLSFQRIEDIKNDPSTAFGLAASLRAGDGYLFNGQPHTVYPPGLPALLVAVAVLVDDGYVPAVLLMPLFAALALLAYQRLLRLGESAAATATILALSLSTPVLYELATHRVGSDIPFMALLAVALALADGRPRSQGQGSGRSLGLTLCVLAAVAFRSAAISLLAGLAAAWVARRFERRKRVALALPLAAGAIAQIAWMAWTAVAARPAWEGQYMETGYLDQLLMADPHDPGLGLVGPLTLLSRIGEAALVQTGNLAEMLSRQSWVEPHLGHPLVLLPLWWLLSGWWRSLRRAPTDVLPWFAAAYFCLHLLWPFDEGHRFLLPVLPLALLLLWRGLGGQLADLAAAPERARWRWLVLSLVGLLSWLVAREQTAGPTASSQLRMAPFAWVTLGALAALWPRLAGTAEQRARWLPAARAGGAVLLSGLVLTGLLQQVDLARQNLDPDPSRFRHQPSVLAFRWIDAHLPPDARVQAGQASIGCRLLGRPVVPTPISHDPGLLEASLDAHAITHWLVLDTPRDPYFTPTEVERLTAYQTDYPGRLELVHSGPGYRVFATRRPVAPGTSAPSSPARPASSPDDG